MLEGKGHVVCHGLSGAFWDGSQGSAGTPDSSGSYEKKQILRIVQASSAGRCHLTLNPGYRGCRV